MSSMFPGLPKFNYRREGGSEMTKLLRKLLILVMLLGGLGLASSHAARGTGALKAPCCSSCGDICDACEFDPRYCGVCANCPFVCNHQC